MAPANQTIDLPNEVGNTTSTPQDHVNKHYTPNTTTNPPTPGNFSYRITTSNQDNNHTPSTEEVVAIGKRLQEEFYNLTQGANLTFSASPANHTGNWKTAFLYNLAQLVANVFPTTVAPAKIIKPTFIPPASQNSTETPHAQGSVPTKSENRTVAASPSEIGLDPYAAPDVTSNRVFSTIEQSKTKPRIAKRKATELKRNKRAVGDQVVEANAEAAFKYDLTPKNVGDKLKLTPEQITKCQRSYNNLRRSIARYNALGTKNTPAGQDLLSKQGIFLEKIQERLKLDFKAIEPVMTVIKTEFKSHRVPVDKHLHGIWVAGAPPEDTATYIKVFLEAYHDFDFIFWVDEKAYGAAKFTSTLKKIAFDSAVKELREQTSEETKRFVKHYDDLKAKYESTRDFAEKEKYSEDLLALYDDHNKMTKEIRGRFDALFLENMIVAQDGFFNFCLLRGIDSINDETRVEYLEKHLELPKDEIEQYKKTIEANKQKIKTIVDKVNAGLKEPRAYIRDISELRSMREAVNLYNYETEMFLRWNYPAATDQVRMYMLKEHGGIYMDLDMMPAYSTEFTKKILEVGQDRFFESLKVRRAISYAVLKLVGEGATSVSIDQIAKDIDLSGVTQDDKTKLTKLIKDLEGMVKEKKTLFQKMAPDTIRDFMPILQRYHRWRTKWNIRGLNGLMMAHKGSATVDAVIRGQQQAYSELRALRQRVISGEYFNRLSDLTHVDYRAEIGGVLVKNYLAGSLFTDFRQDSIISGAVSTLGISGPDLIMSEMVKYFRELGPVGRDFLNDSGNKLGKEAFLGAYKELDPSPSGERRFDWANPISVGVNDVTPADESTWCGIRPRCVGELLFSDESKLRVEKPKRIVRTRVEFEELTKLWSEESKKYISRDLLERFNALVESKALDAVKLSELDRDIYVLATHVWADTPAREAVFSLQIQLAELVRSVPFPISNQLHLSLNVHENFETDLARTIRLYLQSNTQTDIVLWYSALSEESMFLKDMLGVAERSAAVKRISEITKFDKYWEPYLSKYVDLKSRETTGVINQPELEELLDVSSELSKNQDLFLLLEELESRIQSGYRYRDIELSFENIWDLSDEDQKKKILSVMKDMTKDNGENRKDQKKWFEEIYDKARTKRLVEPAERVAAFMEQFAQEPRVLLYNVDSVLSENHLFMTLQKEGYAFRDLNEIYRFMLADTGVSGLLSGDNVLPSPSKQLIDLIKKAVGDEYIDIHDTMKKVYAWLAEPQGEEATWILNTLPESLKQELPKYAVHNLLTPPVNMEVSALGIKYALEAGLESERVMASLAPGVFNPASYTMMRYLEALHELHRKVHDGSLTHEFAKQWLETKGGGCFITEPGIDRLVELAKERRYLSITEIHRELTGMTHLGQATMRLLSGAYPGLGKLMEREAVFGRPLATSAQEPMAVYPYDYLGAGSSKDLFSTPPDVPTTISVIERAKYTLLSWPEFYELHASAWEGLASGMGADSIKLHPQSFLYETEGRCVGLSMLYMSASDMSSYSTLQDNLTAISALFQTKERDKLPLSKGDRRLLERSLALINWLQYQGNKQLLTGGILSKQDWNRDSIRRVFETGGIHNALITTPTHSLVLHNLGSSYRVTDPNFGHVDFLALEHALEFVETMMYVSPEIKERYGFSDDKSITEQLKFYTAGSEEARNAWLPATDMGLHGYLPTSLEKMILRGETTVSRIRVRWSDLFEMGALVDHERIDENTRESDLERLKFHGDLLEDFLATHALDSEQVETVKALLETCGIEAGTTDVSVGAISETPSEVATALSSANKTAERVRSALRSAMEEISLRLKEVSIGDWDHMEVTDLHVTESEEVIVKIRDGKQILKTIQLKVSGLLYKFKRFGSMLNEVGATGAVDFDLGLAVVSIVQYARMIEHGLRGEPLAVASAALGVKQTAELTVGAVIQALGQKYLTEQGVVNFRLETALAQQLYKASVRVGGTLGEALSGMAHILELPILETVLGVWGLAEGIKELLHSDSYSAREAARVRVAFDSITLGLTMTAMAAPASMLAVGPIAAIGMGATSIAHNVAKKEERYTAWLKYKSFLIQGSKYIVKAFPDKHLLDLSGNLVLGDLVLDLRYNPPLLKGTRSYNWDRRIGSHPSWSDREVRAKLGYGYVSTPYSDLAQGHANSLWPRELPQIPKGEYTEVILGYGITYRATTEVVYLSNKAVWREAILDPAEKRYYVPPLTIEARSSTIIAGESPLTVIPLRVLDGDTKEKEDNAATYKDYTIRVKGGVGGLTVQVGGAGHYDIEGAPGANNVISFQGIPSPLGVEFNLSLEEQNVPLIRANGTKLQILSIKQKNFATIVGSEGGQDILTGNQDANFHIGKGGGTVFSGLGSNKYYIPPIQGPLVIKLADNSSSHTLFLETSLSDWRRPDGELTLVPSTSSGALSSISIVSARKETSLLTWVNHIEVKTKDGIVLTALEEKSLIGRPSWATFGVLKCDLSLWKKKHPREEDSPTHVVSWLKRLDWRLASEVSFLQKDCRAVYYDDKRVFLFYPSPYTEVNVRAHFEFSTKVEGSVGCVYLVSSPPNLRPMPLGIGLAADWDAPQIVDLGALLPSLILARASLDGEGIDVSISSPRYEVHLTLTWDPKAFPEKTIIEIYPKIRPTLKEWNETVKKSPNEWQAVYRHSELIPERLESVRNLNNTVIVMLDALRENEEYILGVENKGDVEVRLVGEMDDGLLKGVMEDQHWHTLPKPESRFNITLPAHSIKYLALLDAIWTHTVFHTKVEMTPLEAKVRPVTRLSYNQWSFYDEIHVKWTSLELEDFTRYTIADETEALSRQLMYAQGQVAIVDRDFILKFFYVREKEGIGAINLVFKDFFTEDMEGISSKTLEREAKPILANNPHILINPAYRPYLNLVLGKEKFNLASLAKEFSSTYHITPLEKGPDNKLVLPKRYASLRLAVLTYTINPEDISTFAKTLSFADQTMKEYRLPAPHPVIRVASYYLDPVSGDLYLTRILSTKPQNQAFVIRMKGYKHNWGAFQKILVAVEQESSVGSHRSSVLSFVGPELRHLEVELSPINQEKRKPDKVLFMDSLVLPINDQVLFYDQSSTPKFYSFDDYVLWNLRDRVAGSKRAQAYDNYLLEATLRLGMQHKLPSHWEIPQDLLRYGIGYYGTRVPQWIRGRIREGSFLRMSSHNMGVALITTQNNIFRNKDKKTAFNVYYSILGLYKYATLRQLAGEMVCDFDKRVVFRVKKVDEKDYNKRNIYIVMEVSDQEEQKLKADSRVLVVPGEEVT